MNKANKVNFVLGLIAMTSCAALTPPTSAKALEPSLSFQNILNQAKLSLDNQNQQSTDRSLSYSIKKIDDSFKTALPHCCNRSCGRNRACDGLDLTTDASVTSNKKSVTSAHDNKLNSQVKTSGCALP